MTAWTHARARYGSTSRGQDRGGICRVRLTAKPPNPQQTTRRARYHLKSQYFRAGCTVNPGPILCSRYSHAWHGRSVTPPCPCNKASWCSVLHACMYARGWRFCPIPALRCLPPDAASSLRALRAFVLKPAPVVPKDSALLYRFIRHARLAHGSMTVRSSWPKACMPAMHAHCVR
jgi:hypothetical protein